MMVEKSAIDYSKKWFVMAAVAMGIFLATIDGSIVNVAIPTLAQAFETEFAVVQWVVLAYLLTLTTLMLGVGRLADMIGKKRIYNLGFIVFTIGSVLCGLSWSIHTLIGFRVLQAIGAAMVISLGMAIVTEAFPPDERGLAIGVSGSMVSVGIVVGPTLGGLLIDVLSWRWVFFVNLPIGLIGTWLAFRFVPSKKPAGGQFFDYQGAITLFISLLSLLLALTLGQRIGFTQPSVLALLFSALASLSLFILIELKSRDPMLNLRLFRNRFFSASLIMAMITFISIAGTTFLMPFYLENVLGYVPSKVGLLLAVVPTILAIVSPVAGALSDHFGSRAISLIGLVLLLIGYSAMRTLGTETTATGFILRFLAVGLGMGVFQSPNNSAIMGAAPKDRLGVISGVLAITRTLGQTTGIAILGSVWAGRVLSLSGNSSNTAVTTAPANIQVAALQHTFTVIVVLIAVGLGLGIWALASERHQRWTGQKDPFTID